MEIISAKYLLTLNNSDEPIENGALAIELGKIKAIGKKEDLRAKFPEALEIKHPNHIIMPGLVNAHAELDLTNMYVASQSMLREQPTNSEYIDWLIEKIEYREKTSTTQLINGIQMGLSQSIECGTTCIGDTTTFEGSYNIMDEMGIRGIIFNEIYGGTNETSQDLFENSLALIEKYFEPSTDERLNVGFAPLSSYLLSKNLLRIIGQHSQNGEVPLKIHAAESFVEMEFFFDSKGPIGEKLFPTLGWDNTLPPEHKKTPLAYLDEIGFLKASPAIIGGLHLSEACLKLLARNMCRIIYCPRDNNYFGHGTLPIEKLKAFGIPIGLGTGTPQMPHSISMWDEMREVLKTTTGTIMPKEIMQMATIGSARAMGLENQIGTLVPGKLADFIVVDLPPGHEIDKTYIYGALIRNTHHFNVKKTVVNGEILKSI